MCACRLDEILINCLLKMLIILTGIPASAPGKSMFFKKPVAQIVFIDFVREIPGTVGIYLTSRRRDIGLIVFSLAKHHIRVIKRVNVNGTAQGMLGKMVSTVYNPVIEAGGIIIQHGGSVVAVIFIDQRNLFNLIFILEQLIKYFQQILGNSLIADQLPCLDFTVKIIIKHI